MELTKEKIIIAVVSGVIIIGFGLYLFLYGPLINKLRIAHLDCRMLEEEVLQVQNKTIILKTSETRKDFLPEEDVSLAIDELTKIGKSQGLNFISMIPEEIRESEVSFCKVLPITMEIESAYRSLGRFLGSLSELEKSLGVVSNFKITPVEKNPTMLKTKLSVDMYLVESK